MDQEDTPDHPTLHTSVFPSVHLFTVQRLDPNPAPTTFALSLTIKRAHFIHGFLDRPELFLIGT